MVVLAFDGTINGKQSYKPSVLKVYFHDVYSCTVFKLTNVLSSGAVGALEERVANLEAAKGPPTRTANFRARGNVHCSYVTLETLLYEVMSYDIYLWARYDPKGVFDTIFYITI